MKRFQTIIASLLIVSSINAQSQIDSIVANVASNNLMLKSLRHQHNAEILELKAENSISGPGIEYSPFYKKGYTGLAESELIVKEDFDFPTKYAARKKQVRLRENAYESQYESKLQEVTLQARLLCIDIVYSNNRIAILTQRQQVSNDILRMMQQRLDAGDANILELNKAKLDCMETDIQLEETKRERISQLQLLRNLNGGICIDCPESCFPEESELPPLSHLSALVQQNNAEILLAHANLISEQQSVNMSKQEWLPNITMGYRRNTEMKEAVNGVIVGLSFPLLGSNSKLKSARERQKGAEIALQQAQQSAIQVLESTYEEYQSLDRQVKSFDENTLDNTLTLLHKALDQGQISILQYFTEADFYYETYLKNLDAKRQKAALKAKIDNLNGAGK